METDCTAVVFFLTSFHKRGSDLFRINLGGPQELVDRPSQVTRGQDTASWADEQPGHNGDSHGALEREQLVSSSHKFDGISRCRRLLGARHCHVCCYDLETEQSLRA